MAGTMARAAGLFMAICVLYASGSSQSVPDGQVYTEVKKTLVLGSPGVLTCHFFGDPVAVYWEKSSDSEDLDRILVWHNGEVSGPRYDDGSCDIDENYSLIIKNVSLADAGRIYCTVSNYRGILINNYTDVFVAGTGSSQSVPDGKVYTDVKKTLVLGFPGVLTCHFFRDPVAVYWEKGHGPSDLEPILVWHNGEVSGPRHDDGGCEIDENYSLIINNVSTADAGRIYCTVSNYRGIVIKNYTDVSVADTAVETRSEDTLVMSQGTYGVLQCTVRIKARRVSWRKGTPSTANGTLVVLENDESQAARSGFGYDEGMYNITEDYSLIIKNVQVHHEGLYVCQATDFETGISYQSHTFVNLIAHPRKPFPIIQECMKTKQNDSQYCTLDGKSEITLTCQVMDYYPEINLFFLHGSKEIEPLDTKEWYNTDGTKNKTVTIAAKASKELYTCVASDIPGSHGSTTTSVLLHDDDTFNSVLVIVLVCFAALLIFSIMAYFIWRRKHRHSDSNYAQVEQVELQYSHIKDLKDLTQNDYQALQGRLNDVLMMHNERMFDFIDTKSNCQADRERIICENRTCLFDTEQMLKDWRQNPESECRQYIEAMQVPISPEDKSDTAWPSNEELRWISHHLNQESMKEICKKLEITYKPEDDNEGKRYDCFCEWRDNVARGNVYKIHNQLSLAMGSKHFRGLLPPLKGRFLYKAELIDMVFNILMQDLLPLAEALGINATKLISYRPAFQPTHLEIGTIGLMSKLLDSATNDPKKWKEIFRKRDVRSSFWSRIEQVAYRNVARPTCGMVAYDMSYGELYAISEAMACIKGKAGIRQGDTSEVASHSQDGKCGEGAASQIPEDGKKESASITKKAGVSQGDISKAATQSEDDKCEKGDASKIHEDGNKEETDNENPESEIPLLVVSMNQIPEPEKAAKDTETMDQRTGIQVVEIPDLRDLQRMLQLTDQDIADGLGSSHPITAYTLFKIWKETPRPLVFNYRAALAHELRGIQMPDLADDVIAGKYITEQTSLKFIHNIVKGLSQDELRSLGKLLNLSGEDEHNWHTRTPFDVICKQIYEWVGNWTKQMKKSRGITEALDSIKEVVPKLTSTSEKHRDLNDKLVENGFLDLAREIMIIEQQME